VKVTDEITEAAIFACEQHLNNIGMINYTGPMIQTGTLSFGLRIHMFNPIDEKGEVVERLPSPIEKLIKFPDVLGDMPDEKA
jgi:hypothetical protein